MFAAALSRRFRAEMPRYGALVNLVTDVNREVGARDRVLAARFASGGGLEQLGIETHGAVRVGTAEELSTLRRLFAVMGLEPVGYYDLSAAGLPVHSTAFRPITETALERCPFRVFTSLLRLEAIGDPSMRREAAEILDRRAIVSPLALELVQVFEARGELDQEAARLFVAEAAETFRWHGKATVCENVYRRFREAHPLLADIVCFERPHINHLTLATLDIDMVQDAMVAQCLQPKAFIEGPPRRNCPILLRQTSFRAVEEEIVFEEPSGETRKTVHSARFGEVEQRGIALTSKGRAYYDELLAGIGARRGSPASYRDELRRIFEGFPDDYAKLRTDGLAHFRYAPTKKGLARIGSRDLPRTIEGLLEAGDVEALPIVYEDFLPVSAAGIFRSNLGDEGRAAVEAAGSKAAFEAALGCELRDEQALYAAAEARSRAETLETLGLGTGPAG